MKKVNDESKIVKEVLIYLSQPRIKNRQGSVDLSIHPSICLEFC